MARLRFDSLLLGALIALVFMTGVVPLAFLALLLVIMVAERFDLAWLLESLGWVLWYLVIYSPLIYYGLVVAIVLGLVLAVVGPRVRRLLGLPPRGA